MGDNHFENNPVPAMPISLAPGFRRVIGEAEIASRFNGFERQRETVETVSPQLTSVHTRLKPGANETMPADSASAAHQ
jgi:hypothetical protein